MPIKRQIQSTKGYDGCALPHFFVRVPLMQNNCPNSRL